MREQYKIKPFKSRFPVGTGGYERERKAHDQEIQSRMKQKKLSERLKEVWSKRKKKWGKKGIILPRETETGEEEYEPRRSSIVKEALESAESMPELREYMEKEYGKPKEIFEEIEELKEPKESKSLLVKEALESMESMPEIKESMEKSAAEAEYEGSAQQLIDEAI